MEEKKVVASEEIEKDSVLRKVISIIKRDIFLIILIVLAFMLGGFIFAKLRKPTYTATNNVTIVAKGLLIDSVTSNIDYLSLDAVSVLDFCKTGVVADRADFYYTSYLKELESKSDLSCEEYAKAFSIFEKYNALKTEEKPASYDEYMKDVICSKFGLDEQEYDEYLKSLLNSGNFAEIGEFNYFMLAKKSNNTLTLDDYMSQFDATMKKYDAKTYDNSGKIVESSISTTGYKNNDKYNNHFAFKYFDVSAKGAIEKVTMVVLAASTELVSETEYFKGVSFIITPNGSAYSSTNNKTRQTVLIAFLAGIVVSAVVVYLKSILDKTIKDKKTLEELTGVKLICYISKREDN